MLTRYKILELGIWLAPSFINVAKVIPFVIMALFSTVSEVIGNRFD
jgi:hypothetical protein